MRELLDFLEKAAAVSWLISLILFVVVVVGSTWYLKWKFGRIVREAVLEAGSSMKDAAVVLHAVTAAARPSGPSPYDIAEDDEQYDPDLDGTEWDEDGVNFYSIDATISPADPTAAWDPTGLAVVPADFIPDDPTDVCEKMGGLHSAEVFENGRFAQLPEGELRGPRRVRYLFGIPDGVRQVKFASLVTYFGHVDLPVPVRQPMKHT